jgi:hypothetical protein
VQAAAVSIEDKAKKDWDESAELRAEFGVFEKYLAFSRAQEKGLVKMREDRK